MKKRIGNVLPWAALAAGILLSLAVGRYRLGWDWAPGSMDSRVFLQLRVGRTAAVLVSGIALGVSGSVFQTVFHNPLASPDLAGAASGASAGAALSILLFSGTAAVTPLFAFFGGMAAVLTVIALHTLTDRTGVSSLVICGVCVNALFQALLAILKISADRENVIASIEFWLLGSFSGVTLGQFRQMLPWIAAGLMGLGLLHRPVSLLALGDDEARSLGVPVGRTRALALILSTMAVAAVISRAGLVSFVGLLAPHIARLLPRGRKYGMLYAGVIGADLLLAADLLARGLTAAELPISVPTSLLGVPVLFALLIGRKRHAE